MITAQPLDGDNLAGLQERNCPGERVSLKGNAGERKEGQVRAARRAGDRLGVVAPRGWIPVLGATGGTEGKISHCRLRPVIRDAGDERKTRTAVGAINKGVVITAIVRVEELGEAIVTKVGIRGNRRHLGAVARAGKDLKGALVGQQRQGGALPAVNAGQGGGLCLQGDEKKVESQHIALRRNHHPAPVIEDRAGQTQPRRQLGDKRPKTDPLHQPFNLDL